MVISTTSCCVRQVPDSKSPEQNITRIRMTRSDRVTICKRSCLDQFTWLIVSTMLERTCGAKRDKH
eukprot:1621159-Amphidinium_carterae.1